MGANGDRSLPCEPRAEECQEGVKRFRRRVAILHDGDPDIAETRIAAVGLLAREIAARNDPQTSLAPQSQRDRLVATMHPDVEQQKEHPARAAIAATAPYDLNGEIEF